MIVLYHRYKFFRFPNQEHLESSCFVLCFSGPDDRWFDYGCSMYQTNRTHTVCHCSHLTNFALLFDFRGSPVRRALYFASSSSFFMFQRIGPLQWGSRDQIFLRNVYIMGYNLKNVRNGKSASKIAKWPSLRPPEFKSKFIWQYMFEFSENLEDLMLLESKVLLFNNFFHTNLLILFEVHTVIKSQISL